MTQTPLYVTKLLKFAHYANCTANFSKKSLILLFATARLEVDSVHGAIV